MKISQELTELRCTEPFQLAALASSETLQLLDVPLIGEEGVRGQSPLYFEVV